MTAATTTAPDARPEEVLEFSQATCADNAHYFSKKQGDWACEHCGERRDQFGVEVPTLSLVGPSVAEQIVRIANS